MHLMHWAEPGRGAAPRIWQLRPPMTTCLPIKFQALLPDTESEMSIHATQVSAWGEVRIKRGACLMNLSSEAPTGDERRAAWKAVRWVVCQTFGSAGICGTSMTFKKDVEVTGVA
jgi:hypothetical protein